MPTPLHPRSPLARLFAAPGRFDFFQAVRLLERLAVADWQSAVGGDHAPEQEAVLFRVLPALRFAEGPVAKATPGTDDTQPELTVAFGGLTGPDGILPQHYTALLISRQRLRDTTLRDWFDVFHHRALSLFMRGWEKNRWPAVVDRRRAEGTPGDDAITAAGFAIAGFGTPGLRDRLELPDDAAVFYAGFLARQPRPASGLEQILGEYFGWPVAVQQLCGQWLYLDAENKAEVPTATSPGRNVSLGRDVVIGRRVWDVQGKARIVVGPVDAESFRSLLPGGDARVAIAEWVRLYLGLEFDAEVQVLLQPDAVPWAALEYDEVSGPRLGLNTWVRAHNFGQPVGDVRFEVK